MEGRKGTAAKGENGLAKGVGGEGSPTPGRRSDGSARGILKLRDEMGSY